MSERVLLMVSPQRLNVRRTVVGSDVLPRRGKCGALLSLKQNALRPQSDRGKKHELGLFTQTRDHSQTLEKSDRRSMFSVDEVTCKGTGTGDGLFIPFHPSRVLLTSLSLSHLRYRGLPHYVLPLSIGVD